jgi:hypothetical protein
MRTGPREEEEKEQEEEEEGGGGIIHNFFQIFLYYISLHFIKPFPIFASDTNELAAFTASLVLSNILG